VQNYDIVNMKMTKNYGDDDNGLTDNGSSLPHPETMKNFSLSKTVDDHDDDDDDVSPLHSKAATPREGHDLFLDEEGGGGLDHMKNYYNDNDDNDNDDDDGLTSSKKGRGDVLSLTSSNGRYTWRCYLLMFLMFTIFLGMLIPLAMKEEKQTEGKAYTALQQENKDLKAQMITANKEIGMLEEAYYDEAEKNGVDTEEDDDYYYNSGTSNDDDSTTVSPSDFGVEADDDTVILIGDDYDYVYEFDGEGTGQTHSSELGLSRGNAGTDDVTNHSWISSKVDGVYVGGNASPSSAP